MRAASGRRGILAAAMATPLLWPVAALADTATAANTDTTAAAAAGPATSEVIVTATKRSVSVQEVPAAVTAVTSQVIEQRGITSTEDLQFAAPSVQVGTFRGAAQIAIRGVGLNSGSSDTPGVAVYVDGVYQPHPSLGSLSEVDLDRVEVLRGPQGTLYGRNANGGAVNFISNAPTQQFGGYVLGDAETYGEYRAQAEVNVPLSANWAARAVVNYDNREQGFIKNIIPGYQNLDRGEVVSGRFQLQGDLTDKLKVNFEYAGEHSGGPFSYFTLHNKPSAIAIALNPYFVNAIVPLAPWQTSANDPSGTDRNYNLVSGTVTWSSPIGEFKSITAYQTLYDNETQDDDATNLSAFPSTFRNLTDTFTEEDNLSSKIGPVDAIAGVFFMQDHENNNLLYHFPLGINPLPPTSYLNYTVPKYNTESVAGYLDLTWNITSQLRAIGGVRYSVEHQDVDWHNEFGHYVAYQGPFIPFLNPCNLANVHASEEATQSFHAVTPRAGLQYDFNSDQNVYGTYSEGYKAGGLNASACDNPYKPEQLTAYEIGYKGRFLDRRLTFDVSGFYYDYTDLQISEVIGLQALVENAAAARIEGVEFASDYTPDNHFVFDGSLTLLDATYLKFFNEDGINPYGIGTAPFCVTAAGQHVAPVFGVPCTQDLKGHHLNNAPKVSANVGLSYRTETMSWGDLLGRIDVTYRSRTFFREFNLPLDAQPSFALLNLSLIWTHPDKKYSVRLFADNVTNVGYITTMGTSNNFGSRFITWGDPRQVGVELKAAF